MPLVLLTQARLAARNGVSLDAVLRRYAAGHSLLADILLEEASAAGVAAADLKAALRALASRFDRVVAAVGQEYAREDQARPAEGTARRRAKLVEGLLRGEPIDPADLAYDLGGWHLAVLGSGLGAASALGEVATALDRRLLKIDRGDGRFWAWLGGHRPFGPGDLDRLLAFEWPAQGAFACGEPAQGLAGWRLTHRQAGAALPIAERSGETLTRYSEAILLAAVIQDDLLLTSLRQSVLDRLEADRDEGEVAKQTLRAYIGAEGNVASAAIALGVSRRTVANRLCRIEAKLGRSLSSALAEIEVALRLEDLDVIARR